MVEVHITRKTQAYLSTLVRYGDNRWEVQMLGALPSLPVSPFHMFTIFVFFKHSQLFLFFFHLHFSIFLKFSQNVSLFFCFPFLSFFFPLVLPVHSFLPFSHHFHSFLSISHPFSPSSPLSSPLRSRLPSSSLFSPVSLFPVFPILPIYPFTPFAVKDYSPHFSSKMLSAVRLIRGSSYNVGHDFEIPHTRVQQQCFFLMRTVCRDSQDSSCSWFFFLKFPDSATSDVPSSLTASCRTNREVSGEVDDRVL